MATVSNTITLQDRLTPAITRMVRAMQSAVSSMEAVDRTADRMNGSLNEIANGSGRAESSFSRLGARFIELQAIGSVVGATIGFVANKFNQFTGVADTFNLTAARLNNVNDGLQTTDELQDMIFNSAERARGSYVDMGTADCKNRFISG